LFKNAISLSYQRGVLPTVPHQRKNITTKYLIFYHYGFIKFDYIITKHKLSTRQKH